MDGCCSISDKVKSIWKLRGSAQREWAHVMVWLAPELPRCAFRCNPRFPLFLLPIHRRFLPDLSVGANSEHQTIQKSNIQML
jgi:hypothetical protein